MAAAAVNTSMGERRGRKSGGEWRGQGRARPLRGPVTPQWAGAAPGCAPGWPGVESGAAPSCTPTWPKQQEMPEQNWHAHFSRKEDKICTIMPK
jgi:hypothetical protein